MGVTPALRRLLRALAIRSACAFVGLVIYGFGLYLQLQASLGLSPWDALSLGISMRLPISLGTASILISLAVIALDLALREPIGLGTILDALIIGWVLDLCLWLDLIPPITRLPLQLGALLLSLILISLGTYLYMKPALSCGPRDALLVALGRRLPRCSIGSINMAILASVLALSILLGSPLGLGTFLTVFGTGAIMDLVFRLLRFEPRSLTHENLIQTWSLISSARRESEGADAPSAPTH